MGYDNPTLTNEGKIMASMSEELYKDASYLKIVDTFTDEEIINILSRKVYLMVKDFFINSERNNSLVEMINLATVTANCAMLDSLDISSDKVLFEAIKKITEKFETWA